MSALAGDLIAAYFTGFVLFGLDTCLQQELSRGWGGQLELTVAVSYSGAQTCVAVFLLTCQRPGSSTFFPAKGCRGDRPFTSVSPLL